MATETVKTEVASKVHGDTDNGGQTRSTHARDQVSGEQTSPAEFLEIREFDQETRKRVLNRVY